MSSFGGSRLSWSISSIIFIVYGFSVISTSSVVVMVWSPMIVSRGGFFAKMEGL